MKQQSILSLLPEINCSDCSCQKKKKCCKKYKTKGHACKKCPKFDS